MTQPSLQRQVPVARFPVWRSYAHDVRFFDEFFKMDLSTLDVRTPAWPHGPRSKRSSGVRSIFPRFPRAGAGLYRDHEEVERPPRRFAYNSRESRRTGPPSRHGCRRSAIRSRRMRALVRRRGCADRSFADRCFARAVAQHGSISRSCLRWRINLLDLAKTRTDFTMNWSPASSVRAELGKSHNRQAL